MLNLISKPIFKPISRSGKGTTSFIVSGALLQQRKALPVNIVLSFIILRGRYRTSAYPLLTCDLS